MLSRWFGLVGGLLDLLPPRKLALLAVFTALAPIALTAPAGSQSAQPAAQQSTPPAGQPAQPGPAAPAANTSRNRALLIANYDYKDQTKLPNTRTDVDLLSKVLSRKDGYVGTLFRHDNLESDGFWTKWEAFLASIDTMTESGIAVFYYSGHGVEIDNDSYLIPVDAPKGFNEAQFRVIGVSLKRLFNEFRQRQQKLEAAGRKVHGVFIIDACRQNPPATEEVTKGLVPNRAIPVPPPAGMLVMYAASAGQLANTAVNTPANTALHAKPDEVRPSIYTEELSKLLEGELAVQTSARRVRWTVHTAVAKNNLPPQTPAYFDELLEQVDIWGAPRNDEDLALKAPLERPVSVGNPVWECETCPHLVVVPGGGFKMGSPRSEPGREAFEEAEGATGADPRLAVTIDRPFAIGSREVTVSEFQAYLKARSIDKKTCPKSHPTCTSKEHRNRPATFVTWKDANDYVTWLNESLGLSAEGWPDKKKGFYRLPTEAEWEYAARAGAQSAFVPGDDISKLCLYGNGADQSLNTMTLFSANNTCHDGKARDLSDVQSYKRNAFGLYDVHGNAWEWVADCWSPKLGPEKASGGATGRPDDTVCPRVARGGGWRSAPASLRLAKRRAFPQAHQRLTLGFRVVRQLGVDEFELTTGPAKAAAAGN